MIPDAGWGGGVGAHLHYQVTGWEGGFHLHCVSYILFITPIVHNYVINTELC